MNGTPAVATAGDEVARRARAIYDGRRAVAYRLTDRLFALLLMIQWLAAVAAALFVSPSAWSGRAWGDRAHIAAALWLGLAIVGPPIALALARPGERATRYAIALAQMLMGALLIHLSGGRIEAHFHVFGSLAFLAIYRDWGVLVAASAIVALDHYLRGTFWPRSIFGVASASPWRWVEHTGWVVFEDVILIYSCVRSTREMHADARHQAELESLHGRVEARGGGAHGRAPREPRAAPRRHRRHPRRPVRPRPRRPLPPGQRAGGEEPRPRGRRGRRPHLRRGLRRRDGRQDRRQRPPDPGHRRGGDLRGRRPARGRPAGRPRDDRRLPRRVRGASPGPSASPGTSPTASAPRRSCAGPRRPPRRPTAPRANSSPT